jgi:hypothetical protein
MMNRQPQGGQQKELVNDHGSDPRQLYQYDGSELGDLVRAGRRRGPSDGAIRRLAERLAVSDAAAAVSSADRRRRWSSGRSAIYALGATALFALAGGLVGRRGQNASPTGSSFAVATSAGPKIGGAAALSEPAAAAAPAEMPAISVQALPSSVGAVIPTPSSEIARVRSAPAAAALPSSSSSEFVLVKRGQQVLVSDPNQALLIAEEHARLFPAGDLLQEREVLAVEALVRLGRRNEAKVRADALLRRFPDTPYMLRLAHSLKETLAPASSVADH